MRELKTVSGILSQQPSWKKFPYRDIYTCLAGFSHSYAMELDDYIREKGVYGCPVRDKAYDKYLYDIRTNGKRNKEIDIHLVEQLYSFKVNPDNCSEQESDCYRRIRVLAEASANQKSIEVNILKEPSFTPKETATLWGLNKEGNVMNKEMGRFLPRPAILTFKEGFSDTTKQLHFALARYHNTTGGRNDNVA